MTITSTTHINFDGDARAALEFYRSVFDGQLALVTYGDAHAAERDDMTDKIMWGGVTADSGFRIMAYDVQPSREYDKGAHPFYESARAETVEEATDIWEKLGDGGSVMVPFGPSAWSPAYGMVTDRFGVTWVIDVAVDYPQG